MAEVPLSFVRDGSGDHGDLLLTLGSYRQRCDSYYLVIDDSPGTGGDVDAALARLREQWTTQLERLRQEPGTVFLPYDFSDQYTGWLQVTCDDGRHAAIQAGWATIEGYTFPPSDFVGTAATLTAITPFDGAAVECDLDDLISAVRAVPGAEHRPRDESGHVWIALCRNGEFGGLRLGMPRSTALLVADPERTHPGVTDERADFDDISLRFAGGRLTAISVRFRPEGMRLPGIMASTAGRALSPVAQDTALTTLHEAGLDDLGQHRFRGEHVTCRLTFHDGFLADVTVEL
jgi:hypothetical protein